MKRAITTLMAVLLITSMGVAPATAQADEESTIEQVFGDDDVSFSEAALSFVSELPERASYEVSNALGRDTTAVQTEASEVQEVFNNNNETIETYVNDRFSQNASEYNVIKVKFNKNDETTTKYIVADVNTTSDEFENAQMVNMTNRNVDKTVKITDGYVTTRSDEELEHFVDEYASEDKDVDGKLYGRLGQYKGGIELPEGVE